MRKPKISNVTITLKEDGSTKSVQLWHPIKDKWVMISQIYGDNEIDFYTDGVLHDFDSDEKVIEDKACNCNCGGGCQDCIVEKQQKNQAAFQQELTVLLNKHSMETPSNTPDFLLAEHLMRCLDSFNEAMISRDEYFG